MNITLTNVKLNEAHITNAGKATYKHSLSYIDSKGEIRTQYIFAGNPVFQKAMQLDLKAGSTINLAMEKNAQGRWNVADVGPLTCATTTTSTSKYKKDAVYPTAKDISQEVSGMLQAVISTGKSYGTEEYELRKQLLLKRKVATELEDGSFTAKSIEYINNKVIDGNEEAQQNVTSYATDDEPF